MNNYVAKHFKLQHQFLGRLYMSIGPHLNFYRILGNGLRPQKKSLNPAGFKNGKRKGPDRGDPPVIFPPVTVAPGEALAPWTPCSRALLSLPSRLAPLLEDKEAVLDHLLPSLLLLFPPAANPRIRRRHGRDLIVRRRSPPTIGASRSRSAWGKRTAVLSSSSSPRQSDRGARDRRILLHLLRLRPTTTELHRRRSSGDGGQIRSLRTGHCCPI